MIIWYLILFTVFANLVWYPIGCKITRFWEDPKNIRQFLVFVLLHGPVYIVAIIMQFLVDYALMAKDKGFDKLGKFYKNL